MAHARSNSKQTSNAQEDILMTAALQRISPFLWFTDKAEEAAKFYTSIFENSKIDRVTESRLIHQVARQGPSR